MATKNETVVKTNPDPTEAVKEALTLAIKNLDEKVGAQFKAIDDSTKLAREELRSTLSSLSNTVNEKFLANKDLVDQLAKANAVALSAALQTQKESAAKSELSMVDLLRQLQLSFDSANKATNEKIDRLTSRLDTGEGSSAVRNPVVNGLVSEMKAMHGTKSEGVDSTWKWIAFAVTLAAGVLLLIDKLGK